MKDFKQVSPGVNQKKFERAFRELAEALDLQTRASAGDLATPFGCCNFFDNCNDELMSLHYSGTLTLLDWMGWDVSDECTRVVEYITYVRPEQDEGEPTDGAISDPCADPYGIDYGAASITYDGFGRYGRKAPQRVIMEPKKRCKTDPMRRLDGTPVVSEDEWDTKMATDAVIADISNALITGSSAVAGQFGGLEEWVATGYASEMLDSIVIDWNSNPMAGGAGITWNGVAVLATFNLVDVLLAAFRRYKIRKSWSKAMQNQSFAPGDLVLVMPTEATFCLLDHYTCWSVCDGSQYNEMVMQTPEARAFREELNGGLYGFGQIMLDGQIIPLIGYDWSLIKGASTYDMYFLTRKVGSTRVWMGDHIDANIAASQYGDNGFWTLDGGRILALKETTNLCRDLKIWMHPRIFCRSPWLQTRIQNVVCSTPAGPISPDPESGYYPETTFTSATCPVEEEPV